jgi:hypothetical protein
MTYRTFDGGAAQGRMVVHRRVAREMIGVFGDLYDAGFPIEHLDATDLYPPAQRPDKLRNVTGAFNCRPIKGTSTWSQHAYGLAVDINPTQNPYVSGDKVIPQSGRPYVDREPVRQGMIERGDAVTDAFRAIGWGWGGNWSTKKDYMHFSSTGG